MSSLRYVGAVLENKDVMPLMRHGQWGRRRAHYTPPALQIGFVILPFGLCRVFVTIVG